MSVGSFGAEVEMTSEDAAADPRKVKAFERLSREGRIDLTSGAWDHPFNVREAHCGRCGVPVPAGDGVPFNTFMRDHYRATTGYLCTSCGPVAATVGIGRDDASVQGRSLPPGGNT